jgi:NAD(P)-dependent dehydrogenase (short-subunit alcohol dehydrogenase family)
MRLKDRVAIVTGAARGIGQEFCLALVREGAKVVAADILPCAETVAKAQDAGGEALGVTADVASAESIQAMANQTLQSFGRIDILVNNAAVLAKSTPFEQIPEADWDRVMAVNIKGMWLCCKAVVPVMRQQGKGKIINISSDTIWLGVPMMLHYVASKGAVLAFTRALARELSGTGINVNAITPGLTLTEGTQGILDPETIAHIQAGDVLVEQQIIKRNEQPSDLAGTVVFLASDDSDFITGQTINVNGGATHH